MNKHHKRKASSSNEDSNDESPMTKCRRLDMNDAGGLGNDASYSSSESSYDNSSKPDKGSKYVFLG